MNIYHYVTQITQFLDGQVSDERYPVKADLIMRLHNSMFFSIAQSKHFLAQFPAIEQVQYVEMAEGYVGVELRDPIEEDPQFCMLCTAIHEEASQTVEIWRAEMIQELADTSPISTAILGSEHGTCHLIWAKMKQLLWERHKIQWRSPAEMNPWNAYD